VLSTCLIPFFLLCLFLLCRVRKPTPLEEAYALSWNPRPNATNDILTKGLRYNELVKPFENIDKEDHLTEEIRKLNKDKREKKRAEKAAVSK
jgi:hypothetical protein